MKSLLADPDGRVRPDLVVPEVGRREVGVARDETVVKTQSRRVLVRQEYGALVPVYGTLATSFIALVIAVPVSFGIALYLSEVAPRWLRTPVA